ncbi:hypothetical protein V8F33_005698 [Rhypophila sp. PSN 637]
MATSRSFILATVRLVLHVIAAVAAVLTLPYIGWSARHGRRRVDSWIVLCIAAGWSIVLNLYEAIRQGLTGIGSSQNPRLLRPSTGHCIGAHIVALIVLLAGLLTLVLSQWGRESPVPRPPDEDQREEEDIKLMVMTLIAGSLAYGLELLFSIFACIDYRGM